MSVELLQGLAVFMERFGVARSFFPFLLFDCSKGMVYTPKYDPPVIIGQDFKTCRGFMFRGVYS